MRKSLDFRERRTNKSCTETNGWTCPSGPAGIVSQLFILALLPTQPRS